MYMKKLIAVGLLLCSTAGLAGGTVTLKNRTGMPLEVFMKSNLESEKGSPIFQSGETHKIVGNKASTYSFAIRTLDPVSMQPSELSSYLSLLVTYRSRGSHDYALDYAGKSSPSKGPAICYYVTHTHNDHDGPHDFDVDITSCY